ncbi:N-formylglutamate amidohydrolase [Roseovarius albus]|uniref:N-formylglutamate amidohydrolase n=1 Tax=Roseovarius albus TaxID=1247867 RepID=A0A1X7A599_9RHOB|nr:N-formylglutamate deformylase [Roseovarius albus]SLN70934.1 N-formylglutamate amidohydrolase [Roseovarius albus]
MQVFKVQSGDSPIVLGLPHGGTYLPDEIKARLNDNGRMLADTDWHIERLYSGLFPGATVVKSNSHRYVIDANRNPHGVSLYPGQNTTTLVPLTDFDGAPIWSEGQEPSDDEIEDRRAQFHTPYHEALELELARVKAKHGVAILFDCHSIRSNIPFLFDGELPIFNTGTNNGETCAPGIEHAVHHVAEASGQSSVLNGRFKGGWSTRHYGQPDTGVHAIQMEISQRAYMFETPPWNYDEARAAAIRPHLQQMLETLNDLALSGRLQTEGNAP